MIGIRTSAYVFRRTLFYIVALLDLGVRLVAASTSWYSVSMVEQQSGPLASIGVQSEISMPVVGVSVVLSIAAYLLAQASVRVAAWLRLASASLLIGSLLVYTVGPGMSALGALLAYGILASGRLEQDEEEQPA